MSRVSDGNAVCFIINDNGTENQFDFFVPDEHTVSTVGYNNKLKQATTVMKLGVNNDVHISTRTY